MNDEQINEVMRLVNVIENLAWSAGKTEQYHDEPTDYAEKLPAARAELEAYLRTIGEPENTFPLNPNGASKWAHLQKHDGAEAIGVVFRTGSGSVGSLVDGRVVWADWLAHPTGSKPAGDDLRWAAGVIEKYDDATIEACYMIDSTDCAAILTALAEYRERFDSPTTKHSKPESVNAELLEALKGAKGALEKVIEDCGGCEHEAGVCVCAELSAICRANEAIARAESAIESNPKPVSPDLLESARAVVARWDAPTWKDLPATAEYIGRLRAAIAQADLGGALTAEEWVVKNVSGSPGLVRAMVIRAEVAESAIETPAKVSPCAGHAVQQEADVAKGSTGLQFKCWTCLDTGFLMKPMIAPEPPDVKCPNGCKPKKGGA